jgi:Domain of unknown function (DUF6438)
MATIKLSENLVTKIIGIDFRESNNCVKIIITCCKSTYYKIFFVKYALPILLFFAFGCHRKMVSPVISAPLVVVSPPEIREPAQIDNRLRCIASLKKTACFGQCPVFEAKIFSDGHAEYFGEKFAPRLGHFSANLKKNWLFDFMKAAESYSFFSLAKYYPISQQKISDLPVTFTFVEHRSHFLATENHFDAPLALREFEKYFEIQLETLEWSPAR